MESFVMKLAPETVVLQVPVIKLLVNVSVLLVIMDLCVSLGTLNILLDALASGIMVAVVPARLDISMTDVTKDVMKNCAIA